MESAEEFPVEPLVLEGLRRMSSSLFPATVFITGASSGFGLACAERFAQEGGPKGCRLILLARRIDRLAALRSRLNVPCHLIAVDIRDKKALQAELAALPEDFRAVDVLINNAGLALGLEPAYEAQLDEWEQMVDTNVLALIRLTRWLLPGMAARRRGHIINMGSVAGSWPYPYGNVYGATKAFVAQFSRNLRADLLGTAVRVTNIEPGMAETEFSNVRFRGDARRADAVYAGVAALTPEDIAEAVFWAARQPAHVNINHIELMPTQQAFGPLAVYRG
jgi:NADP-dependent 3-hydroxy acid dehydrogenase YdfG